MPSILNSDDGVVSGTSGLKTTGGNDGLLNIQTNGSTAISISSGQRSTFPTTIGVGGATPSTSGSGITFPATASLSSNANTLDDYEEGTWTPNLSFSSGSVSYNDRNGAYTRIGNMVVVNFWIYGSGRSSPSGGLSLTGLPFQTSTVAQYRPSTTLRVNQLTVTGQIMVWFATGTTSGEIIVMNNGTPTQMDASSITGNNFEFGGSLAYLVNT
jgi:hypothetical protein